MKNFDKIKSYLNGQLSESELEAFEKEIVENEELALEVSIQRFEEDTIELAKEDDLRNRIKLIQKENKNSVQEEKTKTFPLRKWIIPLSVAASLLLLGGYFFLQNKSTRSDLATRYYDFEITNIRKANGNKSKLDEANKLFQQKQYSKAIEKLSPLLNDSIVGIQSKYLTGHCYFNLKDFEKSKDHFQQIQNIGKIAGEFSKKSKWFWLLSKLALDELDELFYNTLNELVDEKSNQAIDLEKTLQSF